MSEQLNLPALHEALRQLREVRDQLASGPRQIQQRKKRIAQAEQLVVDKTEELKQTRAAADRQNLDLKTKDQNLHSLRGKLNASSTNREYEILRGQIDADTMAKSVLEDEIIELLERAEVIQREIGSAKEAVAKLQADLQEFISGFDLKVPGLKERETKFVAEVSQLEEPIKGPLRDTYRRLVEVHGADALADADAGSCSSCYVNLTPQQRVQVNGGNPLVCGSCGRILYTHSTK